MPELTRNNGMRYQSIEMAYAQNERLTKQLSDLTFQVMDKSNAIMNLRVSNENARDRIKILESEVDYWKAEAKAKDQAMAEICARNHALSEACSEYFTLCANSGIGEQAQAIERRKTLKQRLPGDDPPDQCPCPACEAIRSDGK
jgi:peptidoglycan hydrolase CwlO-like protein